MKEKIFSVFLAMLVMLCAAGTETTLVQASENADDTAIISMNTDAEKSQLEKKKIRLNKSTLSLKVGKKYTLKLKNAKSSKVKWKSSDPAIASVSKKGKVKAKSAGSVIITARYKKKDYTCIVEVAEAEAKWKTNYRNLLTTFMKKEIRLGEASYTESSMFLLKDMDNDSIPDLLIKSCTDERWYLFNQNTKALDKSLTAFEGIIAETGELTGCGDYYDQSRLDGIYNPESKKTTILHDKDWEDGSGSVAQNPKHHYMTVTINSSGKRVEKSISYEKALEFEEKALQGVKLEGGVLITNENIERELSAN